MTRWIHACNSGKDSSSLYRGMTTDMSMIYSFFLLRITNNAVGMAKIVQ